MRHVVGLLHREIDLLGREIGLLHRVIDLLHRVIDLLSLKDLLNLQTWHSRLSKSIKGEAAK